MKIFHSYNLGRSEYIYFWLVWKGSLKKEKMTRHHSLVRTTWECVTGAIIINIKVINDDYILGQRIIVYNTVTPISLRCSSFSDCWFQQWRYFMAVGSRSVLSFTVTLEFHFSDFYNSYIFFVLFSLLDHMISSTYTIFVLLKVEKCLWNEKLGVLVYELFCDFACDIDSDKPLRFSIA